MHFTHEDLLLGLSRLEPSKALPSAFMPARLWKLIPEQVVSMLLPCMNLEASSEAEWHKAGAAQGGKVRSLIQAHASTLPQRFRGTKRPRMLGGISISLDVKKAFDSLSHSFLEESKVDAEFTQPEVDLILHLHSQACLQIGQPGQTSDVYLGTGVRQGCSLSSLLWALSTGRFYKLYLASLQQQNLSEGLTNMFADDVFGSWLFRAPGEFKAALSAIGQNRYSIGGDRTRNCDCYHTMDLEGFSREELQEAAAELQHLQTLAIQGANFAAAPNQPRQAPPQMETSRPPVLEVPLTPSASTMTATPTRSLDEPVGHQAKYTRPEGRGRKVLVGKMAQLLLRHEDFITGLSQSTSWVLFEGTAPPLSAVAAQARLGQEWHRMKRDSPESIRQPLRTILFQTWAAELKGRLEAITQEQASKQQALGLQAMEEPDLFPDKKWNAAHRALGNIPDRAPLTLKEVLTLLDEAIILVTQEGVLVNYHANRRLQEEMAGPPRSHSL
ncbi:secG [Symbiodinium necroappetens]|uniref:SecG protein n=1 Tax=Symbiodinium necroappetens TaxID=1628268 RepID=A0A812ZA77_9DINO|nr:secG [Symbiodinium necroappetens]